MTRYKPIATLAAGLLAGAPAAAQGNGFQVHNSSTRAFTCLLNRQHSAIVDHFVLRGGGDLSRDARSDSPAELRCDTGVRPLHTMIRPGIRYELVDDPAANGVILRIIGAR